MLYWKIWWLRTAVRGAGMPSKMSGKWWKAGKSQENVREFWNRKWAATLYLILQSVWIESKDSDDALRMCRLIWICTFCTCSKGTFLLDVAQLYLISYLQDRSSGGSADGSQVSPHSGNSTEEEAGVVKHAPHSKMTKALSTPSIPTATKAEKYRGEH